MSRTLVSLAAVLLCCATAFGQEQPLAQVTYAKGQEAKLIALLKSDAPQKDKADACRLLAIVGTREAVAPLVALLDDAKLAHMARYGLEPNPDPSVNVALRDALCKLKGLHLVGVIGTLGVRKDAQAVAPIGKLLCDKECVVKQAAARALGRIGTTEAARCIEGALPGVDECCKLAFCEGLLRAAENVASAGDKATAIAICDKLCAASVPPQVKLGAAKKARMLRQQPGKGL